MKLTDRLKKQLEESARFSASRSGGPGGQNVNKVNTQVELRFWLAGTTLFTEEEKARLFEKLKNKINSEGEIILTSQEGRSQLENREIVIQKFFEAIEMALRVQRKRIKTAPSQASVRERLEIKKINAQRKQMRKPPEL
ncbi:MAG TPA: aminoacyl-tRNA hydrolase [Prolixibacteraceae bacterium]|nr:aminoacyl-tRNA hydrolase [Prolixibacteraceae bacterium]